MKAWRLTRGHTGIEGGEVLQFGHAGEGVESRCSAASPACGGSLQFGHAGEGVETRAADGVPSAAFWSLQFGHAGEGVETSPALGTPKENERASIRPRR